MGWGKDAAERLKKREVAGRRTRKESAQDKEKIAANAESLWHQLVERVQADVKEFNDHFHKKTRFRAKLVDSNHLVIERSAEPTARLEFARSPGAKILIEFSGYMFSGFTGVGTEWHAAPEVFRFGLDGQKKPCFVSQNGTPADPAGVSRRAGTLLEEFCGKYL